MFTPKREEVIDVPTMRTPSPIELSSEPESFAKPTVKGMMT